MKKFLHRTRFGFLVSLLAVAGVSCASQNSNSQSNTPTSVWPALQVENIDGVTIDTTDFNSENILVVSLWSTWCVPCRRELPQLQRFADSNTAVTIVAVNLGDDQQSVRDYADELGLTMPILLDSYGRISSSLGVASVPATIFIRDTRVVATHLGEISASQLAELVQKYNQTN